MTTYIALSDGSFLATSDGTFLEILPDLSTDSYDALYARWVSEGQPAYFTFNSITYLAARDGEMEFVALTDLEESKAFQSHHLANVDYLWGKRF